MEVVVPVMSSESSDMDCSISESKNEDSECLPLNTMPIAGTRNDVAGTPGSTVEDGEIEDGEIVDTASHRVPPQRRMPTDAEIVEDGEIVEKGLGTRWIPPSSSNQQVMTSVRRDVADTEFLRSGDGNTSGGAVHRLEVLRHCRREARRIVERLVPLQPALKISTSLDATNLTIRQQIGLQKKGRAGPPRFEADNAREANLKMEAALREQIWTMGLKCYSFILGTRGTTAKYAWDKTVNLLNDKFIGIITPLSSLVESVLCDVVVKVTKDKLFKIQRRKGSQGMYLLTITDHMLHSVHHSILTLLSFIFS